MSMTQWVSQLVLPVSSDRDHILGPPEAPVTLVEYGDFECPYCGQAYPIVEAVRAQMGANLRFVFRHFPLTTVHPHAEQAAEAAEAAETQGAFWPMHAMLYENQRRLGTSDLHSYAEVLGLDTGRFDAEVVAGVHTPRVREDFMSGVPERRERNAHVLHQRTALRRVMGCPRPVGRPRVGGQSGRLLTRRSLSREVDVAADESGQ